MLNASVRLSRGTIASPPKVRRVVGIPFQFFIEYTLTPHLVRKQCNLTFKQKVKIIIFQFMNYETVPRDLKERNFTVNDLCFLFLEFLGVSWSFLELLHKPFFCNFLCCTAVSGPNLVTNRNPYPCNKYEQITPSYLLSVK